LYNFSSTIFGSMRIIFTSSGLRLYKMLRIIEDAAKFRTDRLAKVARILRTAPAEAKDADAVVSLAEYIRQHLAKANLPTRMKDLSITIEQLALVAEDAGQLELINSLPRSMTADDLFDLIKLAF